MEENKVPNFRNAQEAFTDAIQLGRLTHEVSSEKYVGKYMYMYTDSEGKDQFKNITDRTYLP